MSEDDVAELGYADSDDISDYARNSVGELSKIEILNGNENNTFKPFDFATRAEAAQMMYKAMMYIASK